MDNKKIGLLLQQLRKEKNMTQLDLANQLNFTHQTISKWENGDSLPDLATLSTLAKFYQITIDEVVNGERNNPKVELSEAVQPEMIWIIARLASSFMIILSLFLYYVNETIKLSDFSDLSPLSGWHPFDIGFENVVGEVAIGGWAPPPGIGDLEGVAKIQGFDLIFNAAGINLLSMGAWIIFLSVLVLITLFSIVFMSLIKEQDSYQLVKVDTYVMIKKITKLSVMVGFVMILLGVLFNSAIGFNFGYFIGLIFVIGLFVLDILEYKSMKINSN